MRIAVFGVGAMGCLFGARLSPHTDLTLIGRWPDQLAALHRAPLRLIHPDGHEEHVQVNATDDLDSLPPVDIALIVTKAARTQAAAEGATRLLKPQGLAITLQNGIGNLEVIAAQVGAARATLGVTTQGAATEGPGLLRYAGGGMTHLATRPEIDAPVRAFAALLAKADLPVEVVEDLSSLLWVKLAINAAINPLTALLRVRNGLLLESPQARHLMAESAREVAAVAAAKGIPLPFTDPAARAEEVAQATAPNRSSMLQDLLRGVETEIETICGAVMREGEALGVATPVNATLYRLVKALHETSDHRL